MIRPGTGYDRAMTETKRNEESLRQALNDVLHGARLEEAASRHGLHASSLQDAILRLGSAIQRPQGKGARSSRRRLTTEQESAIHALVRDHLPDELGSPDLLWSRETMRWLIERETGMRFPDRTLATYLERWGFAPEKPMRVLASHSPAQVREWLRRDLPVLTMQAREVAGTVYWLGIAKLEPRPGPQQQSKHPNGSLSWFPEGARLLFLTTNRGFTLWLVHRGPPTHDRLIDLIERAQRMDARKVFIIGHQHPMMRSDAFRSWTSSRNAEIHIELMPVGQGAS